MIGISRGGNQTKIIPLKLTRTVSLTGLGKRFLAKRLIYSHILHVTLKTDNCLFGHRRHSLEIILVRVSNSMGNSFITANFIKTQTSFPGKKVLIMRIHLIRRPNYDGHFTHLVRSV